MSAGVGRHGRVEAKKNSLSCDEAGDADIAAAAAAAASVKRLMLTRKGDVVSGSSSCSASTRANRRISLIFHANAVFA